NFARDLDLLALRGLGKTLFEMRELLAALTSPFDFFFAFADGHRRERTGQGKSASRRGSCRCGSVFCNRLRKRRQRNRECRTRSTGVNPLTAVGRRISVRGACKVYRRPANTGGSIGSLVYCRRVASWSMPF